MKRVRRGFIPGITVFLLVLSSGLKGQDSTSDADLGYRVVEIKLDQLNKLVDAGYRILSVAIDRHEETAVLEKRATPPDDTYQHLRGLYGEEPHGQQMLDGLGLSGFRVCRHSLSQEWEGGWLLGHIRALLFERPPGSWKRYRYRLVTNDKIPIKSLFQKGGRKCAK